MMGDLAAVERVNHVLALDGFVPLVLGVHGDGGVSEHRLRTGGGHDDLAAALDGVGERPDGPKLHLGVLAGHRHRRAALQVDVIHLDVGNRRLESAAPVDEAVVAVHEAVGVHSNESLLDRLGEHVVHGEALAGPVEGRAEALELVEDLAAVLLLSS